MDFLFIITRGDRENVPGIPGACQPAILRICQEAHAIAADVMSACVVIS